MVGGFYLLCTLGRRSWRWHKDEEIQRKFVEGGKINAVPYKDVIHGWGEGEPKVGKKMEIEKTLAAFAFTSLVKEEYVKSCEEGIGVLNRSDFHSEDEAEDTALRANDNAQTIEKILPQNAVAASDAIVATTNSKEASTSKPK